MRKFFALALAAIMFVSFDASAEPKKDEKKGTTQTTEKKQTVKKGWNFAPFPSIGYNSDTGFQIGALCEIFDYGDGSTYPGYRHKFNVDLSWTTKDQVKLHFFYDSTYICRNLYPCADVSVYGFQWRSVAILHRPCKWQKADESRGDVQRQA